MADLLPQPVETDPFSEVLLMDDEPDQEALFVADINAAGDTTPLP